LYKENGTNASIRNPTNRVSLELFDDVLEPGLAVIFEVAAIIGREEVLHSLILAQNRMSRYEGQVSAHLSAQVHVRARICASCTWQVACGE